MWGASWRVAMSPNNQVKLTKPTLARMDASFAAYLGVGMR